MDNVYYVKAIRYGQYLNIPVKITKQNEKYCIINHYTKSELQKLGLNSNSVVKIYDRLIIQTKER